MSVELGVVCPQLPDAERVAWLVGPLMCMALHRPLVHALIDGDHGRDWTLRWGGTCTVVSAWEPGRFEYADHWYVNVELGERAIDLSLLLLSITAAAIAIIGKGQIINDAKLISGGRLSGRELSGGDLLTRAVGEEMDRSPQDVLAALGSDSWGEYEESLVWNLLNRSGRCSRCCSGPIPRGYRGRITGPC